MRIALYEKGLPFERIDVWTLAGGWAEKPAELLAASPKGEVPVLVDGELALCDSTVILEYLEERHPEPPLYPVGVAARARCRLLENYGDTVLQPDAELLVREVFWKPDPATRDREAIAAGTAALQRDYERLERELAGREWLCGAFGAADVACFTPLNVACHLGALPPEPLRALRAWIARMRERPAVRRELRDIAAVLREMAG